MTFNISVIEINQNIILYSDGICDDNKLKEFNLDEFNFKIISEEKIIIKDNEKKIIVLFNEIFTINFKSFVIIKNDEITSLVHKKYSDTSKFEFLEENSILKLITYLFKNLLLFKIKNNNKNIKYIKILCLIFLSLYFVFSDKNKLNDEFIDQTKFQTQKNIYLVLNEVTKKAENEIISPIKILNNAPPIIKETISLPAKKIITKKRAENNNKKEIIDSEIEYFMNLSKNK